MPIEEAPHDFAQTTTDTNIKVHNDAAAYSPLYVFMCIVLISAIGFFFWYSKNAD